MSSTFCAVAALLACACLPASAAAAAVGLPDVDVRLAVPGGTEVLVRTDGAPVVDVQVAVPRTGPASSSTSSDATAEAADAEPATPATAAIADGRIDVARALAYGTTVVTALGAAVALLAARGRGSVVPW